MGERREGAARALPPALRGERLLERRGRARLAVEGRSRRGDGEEEELEDLELLLEELEEELEDELELEARFLRGDLSTIVPITI